MFQNVGSTVALFAGGVTIFTAFCTSHWWVYRRGKAAGRKEIELENLKRTQEQQEKALQEITAQLAKAEHGKFRGWWRA